MLTELSIGGNWESFVFGLIGWVFISFSLKHNERMWIWGANLLFLGSIVDLILFQRVSAVFLTSTIIIGYIVVGKIRFSRSSLLRFSPLSRHHVTMLVNGSASSRVAVFGERVIICCNIL